MLCIYINAMIEKQTMTSLVGRINQVAKRLECLAKSHCATSPTAADLQCRVNHAEVWCKKIHTYATNADCSWYTFAGHFLLSCPLECQLPATFFSSSLLQTRVYIATHTFCFIFRSLLISSALSWRTAFRPLQQSRNRIEEAQHGVCCERSSLSLCYQHLLPVVHTVWLVS